MRNLREVPVKINLKIKEKMRQPINLMWPRGGIKSIIYPNQTKTILLLPKIRPIENEGG